jgi:hypothetical protein
MLENQEFLDELLNRLTAALAAQAKPQIPVTIDLWRAREVAAYLKVTPRHVLERYAIMPGFPAPIRLPSPSGIGHPRWKAKEIIAWTERYQGSQI